LHGLLLQIAGDQIGLSVLGAQQIAVALGAGGGVAGLGEIAAEVAERQSKLAMAPDQKSPDGLDIIDLER
jgi:hypothetical protein